MHTPIFLYMSSLGKRKLSDLISTFLKLEVQYKPDISYSSTVNEKKNIIFRRQLAQPYGVC